MQTVSLRIDPYKKGGWGPATEFFDCWLDARRVHLFRIVEIEAREYRASNQDEPRRFSCGDPDPWVEKGWDSQGGIYGTIARSKIPVCIQSQPRTTAAVRPWATRPPTTHNSPWSVALEPHCPLVQTGQKRLVPIHPQRLEEGRTLEPRTPRPGYRRGLLTAADANVVRQFWLRSFWGTPDTTTRHGHLWATCGRWELDTVLQRKPPNTLRFIVFPILVVRLVIFIFFIIFTPGYICVFGLVLIRPIITEQFLFRGGYAG